MAALLIMYRLRLLDRRTQGQAKAEVVEATRWTAPYSDTPTGSSQRRRANRRPGAPGASRLRRISLRTTPRRYREHREGPTRSEP